MNIALQTLIPKDLKRREDKHIKTNLQSLAVVFGKVSYQIASAYNHNEYILTPFYRLDSTKFLQKHPEWQGMERRFEINPGKRILMEYAKQSNFDWVVFTDSDQSMPNVEDWEKCKQHMQNEAIELIKLPVIHKEDKDRPGSKYFSSVGTDSFSFYIIRPRCYKGIDLFDITNMWKAKEGEAKPYAPDNTLFQTLKKRGIKYVEISDVKTIHDSDDAIYTYDNGKLCKKLK